MKKHYTKAKKQVVKSKDSRIVRLILIVVIILSIGVLIGAVSYTVNTMHKHRMESKNIISYNIFNSSVEVTSGVVGLNGDTDGIKYGKIMATGGGTRFLDINTSEDALVQIYLSGVMAQFLSVEKNNFILMADETVHLPVHLSVPNGTPLGHYSGEVHVVLTKPVYE